MATAQEYNPNFFSDTAELDDWKSGIAKPPARIMQDLSDRLIYRRNRKLSPDSTIEGEKSRVEVTQQKIVNSLEAAMLLPKQRPLVRREAVSFFPLQEWEGSVIDINDDFFTARLVDLTAKSKTASEEADFPIEDLSEGDLKLLKPGAVFRWIIGYQRSRGGTKKRTSQIVFRYLPQWTRSDRSEAAQQALKFSESISWS